MLLIIAFHATRSNYSGEASTIVSVSNILFGSWGLIGVDLFVMISAWFLVDQKFKSRRLINIVFQVFSYVLVFFLVYLFVLIKNGESIYEIIKSVILTETNDFFLPLWSNYYWFVTSYFFMYLSFPIVNLLIESISKDIYRKSLIIFSFIPIYSHFSSSPVADIMYFIYLYYFIGYAKKHGSKIVRIANWKSIVVVTGVIILSKLLALVPSLHGVLSYGRMWTNKFLGSTGRHSFIILIDSLLIFFTVIKTKPKNNKFVNKIAESTLGVYLFHENSYFGLPNVLNYINGKCIQYGLLAQGVFFPIQYLLIVLCVFTVGIAVEKVRYYVFHKPCTKYLFSRFEKTFDKVDNWMNIKNYNMKESIP